MHRRAFAFIFGVALFFDSMCAAADRPWVEVRSPNFIVVSNAGEKEARRVAGQFERIRDVFQTAYSFRVDPGKPFIILAARDESSFKEILPGSYERKDQAHRAGWFQSGQDKHYVALRADLPGDQAYHAIYHEYVHMVVDLNFRVLPLWLNEGLAEFYGNSVIGDKEVGIGRPNVDSLRLLQENRLLPLQTLIAVDHSSPYYNERGKVSIFYAESWALTHYLIFVDNNRKLKALFAELRKQTPPADASAHALGDLKELERNLQEYVRRSSYSYLRIKMPTELDEASFRARELSGAESVAVRGDLLVHIQRPEARAFLEDALRRDPNLASAYESMGLLYLQKGERAKAVEWFEQAVKLDSRSFLAHYYYGTNALFAQGSADEGKRTAEQSLKKAIELNPGFAPAYSSLAVLYSRNEGQMGQALEMAVRAVNLEPANLFHRLDAARILMNLERFAEAQAVGEMLLATTQAPNERGMIELLLEDVRKRREYAEERRQLERQIAAIPRAQKAETPELGRHEGSGPPPAGKTEGDAREEEMGKRAASAVSIAGTVAAVRCGLKNSMDVTLAAPRGNLLLHVSDFYKVEFSSRTWTPPDPFLPCTQLEGLPVRVQYYPLSGTRYSGEIVAIEIVKAP